MLEQVKKEIGGAKADDMSAIDYAAENTHLHAENLKLQQGDQVLKEASVFRLGSSPRYICLV